MTTVPAYVPTTLAFVFHIGGGTLGLVSGTVAAFAPKGGRVHRAAGNVFFVSMLVMAIFAIYLAVVLPHQILNVFIATFATYLVTTGWMAVQHREGTSGAAEKIALIVGLFLFAPFAFLSAQLALGLPPVFPAPIPLKGPLLIALYGITTVLALAAFGDARVVFAGGIAGAARIARHLWRMCLGLTLAAGSAFTNGLPRLLPPPVHVTTIFFLPQLIPIGLLIFWMIRVRLTGWYKPGLNRA
jgi:uncharacterized membrane protein